MHSIVVWVLVMVFSQDRAGGPMVIDNIASKENCVALAGVIGNRYQVTPGGSYEDAHAHTPLCVPVRKVVP